MATKPNTVIRRKSHSRYVVEVGGKPLAGVVGIELIQGTKEKIDENGWTVVERDGEPVVRIEVLAKMVTFNA
ncbi:hypothetical protein [Phyllobacterium meliloti]|uniref:hypothetical protein n=1 Tax=Phyllobacterium meliloti TaxID=555317 RepID=UPI001D1359E6|nr:hypothetical protein [Phyllobacterium sp. T1293]UGX87118.1 hypothetical protein LLE53_004535 [Phyllobacterium sp. T1293]